MAFNNLASWFWQPYSDKTKKTDNVKMAIVLKSVIVNVLLELRIKIKSHNRICDFDYVIYK